MRAPRTVHKAFSAETAMPWRTAGLSALILVRSQRQVDDFKRSNKQKYPKAEISE